MYNTQIFISYNHPRSSISHGHTQDNLLPYLSATTDKARAGNHCYGSYIVTPGEFPN